MGSTELDDALALFAPFLPEGSILTIEETDGKLISRYIYRLVYTSKKSGRKMCITVRGETLPTNQENMRFYLLQLILTPREVGQKFGWIHYKERSARQDTFLRGGESGKENPRVSTDEMLRDKTNYEVGAW